eukprot:scaffold20426_cov47-Attheya_sp.AAC.14
MGKNAGINDGGDGMGDVETLELVEFVIATTPFYSKSCSLSTVAYLGYHRKSVNKRGSRSGLRLQQVVPLEALLLVGRIPSPSDRIAPLPFCVGSLLVVEDPSHSLTSWLITLERLFLFPKNRKLAYDARQQLAQVQNGLLPPSELFMLLEEISRSLDIMENLLSRETPSQREVWRRKILELRDDANSVRRQAEHYDRMVGANVRQQRERDALLSRRRRTRRATGEEGEINDLADEYQSMESSQIMMGDLLASGQASLTGLIEQQKRMKGVKRVMLDIGSKIGLSNSTMRIIERRDVTDAYLVFGGMVVTLLLMYFLYF